MSRRISTPWWLFALFYSEARICGGFICGNNLLSKAAWARLLHLPPRTSPASTRVRPNMGDSVAKCAHLRGDKSPVPEVCTATADYSAANEYVRAHYGEANYFDFVGSSAVHRFRDGRALQSSYGDERGMMNENGLALIESPIIREFDWANVDDIRGYYLLELERILLTNLFPSHMVLMHCFWNPIIRGEALELSRERGGSDDIARMPTANIASLVHIDTDVGAYASIVDFFDIVDKNKVQSSSTRTTDVRQFTVEGASDAICHGRKRFVIVNFWRNIEDEPVASAPLALLSTRYDDGGGHCRTGFPNARPNMEESGWYVFPNVTRDEVIAFYQYDRNAVQPSDIWHCAISTHTGGGKASLTTTRPRRSFDIRALVVLDESVPLELDRFGPDRTRPILTFEESGCFCDKQAEDRSRS